MRSALLGFSAFLCVLVAVCYVLRHDAWALLTMIPVWCWLVPGLLLTLPGWLGGYRKAALGTTLLWLGVVGGLADEPVGLLREWFGQRRPPMSTKLGDLWVVTLNCGSVGLHAAREVADLQPDVILLQESPSREQLEALAEMIYGEAGVAVYGVEASLVAHGELVAGEATTQVGDYFCTALLRLADGRQLGVVSLRLRTPEIPLRFWSIDTWRAQTAVRREQREQLQGAIETTAPLGDVLTILAGDFNAPAGDAIYRVLRPRWRDAFAEAGYGWGNTVLNDWPVQRIDQVWISSQLVPIQVRAVQSRASDHRLVVADLSWANDE